MTKFRWWWSWNSDNFEMYLEEMASKGYVLNKAGFGMMHLNFEETSPQNIRYCVDYNNRYTEEYELLLKDDGWSCKGKSSGWRVWAKSFDQQRPELFSDKLSLIERNQRLLKFLLIILMAQFPIAVVNYSSISRSRDGLYSLLGVVVITLYTLMLLMLMFSLIKILYQNKNLKK